MKFVAHGHGPTNGNIIWQKLIAAAHPCSGFAIRRRLKVNHLQRCMYARICTASRNNADGLRSN